MIIVAILAVLAVVTLVAAFLGAKTWHWAHVTVVALLFFTTVGFSFLAAEVLRIRSELHEREQKAAERLAPQLELNKALAEGSDDEGLVARLRNNEVRIAEDATETPGLVNLRHQLRLASRKLGRVWRDAQPLGPPNRQTGQLSVQIEFPQPLGITEGAVLFGFEQGDPNAQDPAAGAQYLAEFRVTGVNGQQLSLEPALALDQREFARLAQSRGPWSFYETMPGDSHDTFASFTDDELRRLLPGSTVDEYIRDGDPATVDDDEWVRMGINEDEEMVGPEEWDSASRFVYQRRLRDYAFLFNDLAKARIETLAKSQALEEDIEKLKATLASAEKLAAYRAQEKRKLETDLSGVTGDRRAIEQHLARLEKQIQAGRRLLERTVASNDELADQLARLQQAMAGGVDFRQQPPRSQGGTDVDAL